MDLSIIIPAYNEKDKIQQDIRAAAAFLNRHHLKGEIIIVDDGSTDSTAETAQDAGNLQGSHLTVLSYPLHKGKGQAVKTGMTASRGETILFIDSGLCVPFEDLIQGLQLIREAQCDIAHASRVLRKSHILRKPSFLRQAASVAFRKAIHWWMKIPQSLTDTQCGLKIYRGDIGRQLYEQCITDGFMFDVEIILRAEKQHLHIREFPIQWRADRDSRLSLIKTTFTIFRELLRIKKYLSSGQN